MDKSPHALTDEQKIKAELEIFVDNLKSCIASTSMLTQLGWPHAVPAFQALNSMRAYIEGTLKDH